MTNLDTFRAAETEARAVLDGAMQRLCEGCDFVRSEHICTMYWPGPTFAIGDGYPAALDAYAAAVEARVKAEIAAIVKRAAGKW